MAGGVTGESASTATLYVCDLDPLVSEAHIRIAFGEVNTPRIRSVRLSSDANNGRQSCYAFVNFRSPIIAKQALDASTPFFVFNSLCRVLPYYDVDSFTRPPPLAGHGVFIKSLSPAVNVAELYDMFALFGKILSCRVVIGEYGVPRGFAYISFSTKEEATQAITHMNGKMIKGQRLFVGPNIPKRSHARKYEGAKSDYTNLFIKGIAFGVSEHEFFDFFAKIGPIDSYSMPLDEGGHPRGFGFVNYKNHSDAVRAVETLDRERLGRSELRVAKAQQRDQSNSAPVISTPGSSANLYIKHLDKSVTEQMLAEEFGKLGKVLSVKVMADDQGISRGFGFVCFEEASAAEKAIHQKHNSVTWGTTLYVAYAQRKDRRYRYQNQTGPHSTPAAAFMFNYIPYMSNIPLMMPTYYGQWPQTMPAQIGTYPAQASYSPSPSTTNSSLSSAGSGHAQPPEFQPSSKPTGSRRVRKQQEYHSSLAAAVTSAENIEAERQVIMEALYPKVARHPSVGNAKLASKVTGLLQDEKREDLLKWIDDDQLLNTRVQQACDILKKSSE